nr:Chain P, Envelope glycoprotein 10-residue peptide [Human immunodeficiency virus 1]
IGPGRAFYTI